MKKQKSWPPGFKNAWGFFPVGSVIFLIYPNHWLQQPCFTVLFELNYFYAFFGGVTQFTVMKEDLRKMFWCSLSTPKCAAATPQLTPAALHHHGWLQLGNTPVLSQHIYCRWMVGAVSDIESLHLWHEVKEEASHPLMAFWKPKKEKDTYKYKILHVSNCFKVAETSKGLLAFGFKENVLILQ